MSVIIYTGKISLYLKRKYFGGFRDRSTRICNSGGVFSRFEERNKGNRVEEGKARD